MSPDLEGFRPLEQYPSYQAAHSYSIDAVVFQRYSIILICENPTLLETNIFFGKKICQYEKLFVCYDLFYDLVEKMGEKYLNRLILPPGKLID